MSRKLGLAAVLGLSLMVVSLPALAAKGAGGGKKKAGPTSVTGVVDSINDTSLVVSKKVKGVADATTLTLTADTKYAELTTGASADVVKDVVVLALADINAPDSAAGVAVYSGTATDVDALLNGIAPALAAQIKAKAGKNAPKPAKGTRAPKPVIGKVKSADGGNLVISPKDGIDVTLKLGGDLVVDKVIDKTRADILAGRTVNVAYTAVADKPDAKVATVVVQMPDAKTKTKGKGKKKF